MGIKRLNDDGKDERKMTEKCIANALNTLREKNKLTFGENTLKENAMQFHFHSRL